MHHPTPENWLERILWMGAKVELPFTYCKTTVIRTYCNSRKVLDLVRLLSFRKPVQITPEYGRKIDIPAGAHNVCQTQDWGYGFHRGNIHMELHHGGL